MYIFPGITAVYWTLFPIQANQALQAITDACASGEGNLLALGIEASRARCSVGEITDAMEKVYGRHIASDRMVSGAYKTEYGGTGEIEAVMKRVEVREERFCKKYGQILTRWGLDKITLSNYNYFQLFS